MSKGAGQAGLKKVGFTIVETMIVLTVTGALFIAIASTLNGRESEAEFVHAIQDAQTKIQQVINQVSAGYYSNNNDFYCQANGSGGITINSSAGINKQQGTNQGCVLLGKVIQFGAANPNQNPSEPYQVYTIAGSQSATVGATSPFQNADPTVVGVFTGSNYGPNSLSSYSLSGGWEYRLSTLWVEVTNSSTTTQIGSVGFLTEPGSLNSSSTGYNSGAQPVDLIPIVNTSLGQDLISAATQIDNSLQDPTLTADAPINPPNGVQICMVSGGTNQSGLISIGSTSGTLLVSLSIKSNKTCS